MSAPSEAPPAKKSAPPLASGDVVADKYRIESLVGEGGMGFVFGATHLQLGHHVAIKVLPSSFLTDRDVTERFLREGRALARLQGEHIARVSDVGTLKSGEPYLVMEFLEGRDLAKELAERGPLPLAETVELLAQACEALAEAHVRGIIHRDLKPANLFLTHKLDGEACIKVLDFGISKIAPLEGAAENDNITVTSTIVGTPKYMSPEQLQDSRSVDLRTDIWGLGTILYELLTQKRPFAAPSLALVCMKILQEEVPPPSSLRKDLPPEVDAIVARCLKKDPTQRFASVGELVEALAPLGPPSVRSSATRITRILAARSNSKVAPDSSASLPGISGVSAALAAHTPSGVRVDPKEGATLSAATLLERSGAKKRQSRWYVVAGGLLVAGGVAFFALHALSSKTEHPTAASSASEAHPAVAPQPTTPPSAALPPPSAVASAAPSASEAPSETPSAHPTVRHAIVHHGGTHTTHATSDPQGTGDVLEDRR